MRRVSLDALLQPADLIFAWSFSILSGIGGGRRRGLGRHGGRLFYVSWWTIMLSVLVWVLYVFHNSSVDTLLQQRVSETLGIRG